MIGYLNSSHGPMVIQNRKIMTQTFKNESKFAVHINSMRPQGIIKHFQYTR